MKEGIREMALSLGADVCGFAAADRFQGAPEGFRPTDIYADCQSVICFGVALPRGLAKIDPRLIYGYFNEAIINTELDRIAMRLANGIERRFGCLAVPMPCDSPYEYWDDGQMEGRGLLSMKHAAKLAGLGRMGKNTLLLNREFGNMLNFGVVLTDLALASDPPAESVCISGCTKCIDSCPSGAMQEGKVVQKLCRLQAYAKTTAKGFGTTECNTCRVVCPVGQGMRYAK